MLGPILGPFLLLCLLASAQCLQQQRVVVAGASGYIGRAVVRELVQRGVPTTALVRDADTLTPLTRRLLEGSDVTVCDVGDAAGTQQLFSRLQPSAVVCCLASRSGIKKDAYAVDYGFSKNVMHALESASPQGHFVLLSAFCVGKPLLQLQRAKLQFEEELRLSARSITHSIVRPTAYFKSLDGQVEQARKGSAIMYFGDGTCAANAIDEGELATFLVDSALKPKEIGMLDETRNVGGPDVPPVSKAQQIDMIFEALSIPPEDRKRVSIPVGIFDVLLGVFSGAARLTETLGLAGLAERAEDAAEIVRIVRYYATEPMVATGPGEVHGSQRIVDHFNRVASRGGLQEVDEYTTTAGVLNLVMKNQYVE